MGRKHQLSRPCRRGGRRLGGRQYRYWPHRDHGGFCRWTPGKTDRFRLSRVHEMTLASKAITAAYYGKNPARAYFNGCSTGGRQALTEAQRYPDDYDGINAGAAANYPTHLQGAQVWTTLITNRSDGYIP